jgi:hypothetical protein
MLNVYMVQIISLKVVFSEQIVVTVKNGFDVKNF